MNKSRGLAYKSRQNIFSSVEMTKSRGLACKSCQNISSPVGMTKSQGYYNTGWFNPNMRSRAAF